MSNFLLIFLCLTLGIVLKRSGKFPETAPKAFNDFVIYLSLPALILVQIPDLLQKTEIGPSLLLPASMPWLMILLSWFFFDRLGKRLQWSRAKIGALVLTGGLGNTAFVGFPLLEALMGREGVQVGLLVDQLGSFPVLSTIGLMIAAYYGGGRTNAAQILRKILSFPPFLSLIAAVFWYACGNPGRELISPVLEKLAATLVPLALVSVGLNLKINASIFKRRYPALLYGLSFKLVLVPSFFTLLYYFLLSQKGLATHATLLESAMAPMITSAVVATEFHLDSEIANLMVGVGIPLSLLTVPIWHQFLLAFAH